MCAEIKLLNNNIFEAAAMFGYCGVGLLQKCMVTDYATKLYCHSPSNSTSTNYRHYKAAASAIHLYAHSPVQCRHDLCGFEAYCAAALLFI